MQVHLPSTAFPNKKGVSAFTETPVMILDEASYLTSTICRTAWKAPAWIR